jgi:hypothetical protein
MHDRLQWRRWAGDVVAQGGNAGLPVSRKMVIARQPGHHAGPLPVQTCERSSQVTLDQVQPVFD